jgi:hypothetical protein
VCYPALGLVLSTSTWVLCENLGLIRSTLPQEVKLQHSIQMELLFYRKLGVCSRRAMLRRETRSYTPRRPLLARLSRESGLTMGQVWERLEAEREYLLNQKALP